MEAQRYKCQYQHGRIPGHRQRREDTATCLRRSRCMLRRQLRQRTFLRRGGRVSSHKVAWHSPRSRWEIMDTQDRHPNYQRAHTQTEKEAAQVDGGTKGADANIKAGAFPATVSAGRMRKLACNAVEACRRA